MIIERNFEVAEEWLNEVLETLDKNSFNDIKKAFYGDTKTAEELSRNELLILSFIQDFINAWGRAPSSFTN